MTARRYEAILDKDADGYFAWIVEYADGYWTSYEVGSYGKKRGALDAARAMAKRLGWGVEWGELEDRT